MSWLWKAGYAIAGLSFVVGVVVVVLHMGTGGIELAELRPVGHDDIVVSVSVAMTTDINTLRALKNSQQMDFTVNYKNLGLGSVVERIVQQGYRIEIYKTPNGKDTFSARVVKHD